MADKTSDDEEKRFSVELRAFLEAHGQRGHGAQQWLADLIGKKKGQVSSWVNAKLIPGERAWDDVESHLAGKAEVQHGLLPRLSATRRVSFSARQARERQEKAARLTALGPSKPDKLSAVQRRAWVRIGDIAERHPWIIERLLDLSLSLSGAVEAAGRPGASPGRAT